MACKGFCNFRTSRRVYMSIGSVYHISQSTNNATNDVNSDSTWRKKSSPQMKLYDGHEPTSWLQRIILTVGSGLGGITYPKRDDLVATFGETSGWYALQYIQSRMMHDETGREILRTKPRINTKTIDLDELRELPRGSLGREYVTFMDYYGYSPDGRRHVKYVDDPERAYVMQRYRELHDFTHTLLQMPTNVYGEIIVKQFEAAQTGLPLCVLGGVFAPLSLSLREQIEMATIYTPWALRNGLTGTFFMNVCFEKHLTESVEVLRKKLNIVKPPTGSLDNDIWKVN